MFIPDLYFFHPGYRSEKSTGSRMRITDFSNYLPGWFIQHN
jgi:hypothetical protein